MGNARFPISGVRERRRRRVDLNVIMKADYHIATIKYYMILKKQLFPNTPMELKYPCSYFNYSILHVVIV